MIGSEGSTICCFNDTATTEIYTLSLHDALPICALLQYAIRACPQRAELRHRYAASCWSVVPSVFGDEPARLLGAADRKSTRLNSSHANISYAVFCLQKTHSTPVPLLLSILPASF